jgi:hypothetical protein
VTERRVGAWWVPALAVVALWLVSSSPQRVDRWYSRAFYPVLQRNLTTLSNLTAFAWLDPLIIGAGALVIWRAWRLVRVARADGVWTAVWEGTRRLVRAAGALVLVFLVAWGLNYRRVPLDVALGTVAIARSSISDLRSVLGEANTLAARLRPGAVTHEQSYADVSRRLIGPLNSALNALGRTPLRVSGRPKFTLFTPYFTWAGIDGMSNPFGLESIVQPGVLPFERPFVLAHEWAHLAGHGDEAEASAVGWLACMHGDATAAYSASLYLITELSAALPSSVWRQALSGLDPGVRADLRAVSARFLRTQPVVREAASRVYDHYLRANGVTDGVGSYSRALSLILLPDFRAWLRTYPIDPGRQP